MKQSCLLIAFIFSCVQLLAQDEPKKWTWTEINWAPCSGVGLNATAAFEVTAQVATDKDNKIIVKNLTVRAKTGVKKVHYSGSLIITSPSKGKETILLSLPNYPMWQSAEGPHVALIVPQKDASRPKESIGDVFVCGDCKLEIVVSMVADLPAGSCALGSSKYTLELN